LQKKLDAKNKDTENNKEEKKTFSFAKMWWKYIKMLAKMWWKYMKSLAKMW
jgi:hypothetical protein